MGHTVYRFQRKGYATAREGSVAIRPVKVDTAYRALVLPLIAIGVNQGFPSRWTYRPAG